MSVTLTKRPTTTEWTPTYVTPPPTSVPTVTVDLVGPGHLTTDVPIRDIANLLSIDLDSLNQAAVKAIDTLINEVWLDIVEHDSLSAIAHVQLVSAYVNQFMVDWCQSYMDSFTD